LRAPLIGMWSALGSRSYAGALGKSAANTRTEITSPRPALPARWGEVFWASVCRWRETDADYGPNTMRSVLTIQ